MGGRIAEGGGPTHDAGVRRSVLLVDDSAGFRGRARRGLQAGPFDVVAEAADGAQALAAAERHRPSVVLLDIHLPDVSGLSVAEDLTREAHPPAVVLTSTHDAEDFGERIHECGALGFVPKAEFSAATLAKVLRR